MLICKDLQLAASSDLIPAAAVTIWCGEMVAPKWLIGIAGLIAVVIAVLNVKLLVDFVLG